MGFPCHQGTLRSATVCWQQPVRPAIQAPMGVVTLADGGVSEQMMQKIDLNVKFSAVLIT